MNHIELWLMVFMGVIGGIGSMSGFMPVYADIKHKLPNAVGIGVVFVTLWFGIGGMALGEHFQVSPGTAYGLMALGGLPGILLFWISYAAFRAVSKASAGRRSVG